MVVTAAVVIIVVASVLMPVLEDATDGDPVTYRNDSGKYVEKSASDGALQISKAANSSDVVVGDNTVAPSTINQTILAITGCSIALAKSTDAYVLLINDTVNNKYLQVASTSEVAVSISAGTCTYSVDTDTYTVTVADDYFYYDPDGSYAVCTPSAGVYVKLSDYVAYVQVSHHTYWYTSEGIYDNATLDDTLTATITSEKVPGSEDKMDYVTGTSINNSTSYVSFAPRATTIHVNEMDPAETAILFAIPVIVILAILLGVVAIVFKSRDF